MNRGVVSIYDGQTLIGSIADGVVGFIAKDREGKKLGTFASRKEAAPAVTQAWTLVKARAL